MEHVFHGHQMMVLFSIDLTSRFWRPADNIAWDTCAATRVLEREAELVSRIQARWRGLSVRRYLIVFRRELRRHREVRASMVYRLQRAVRGWSHRKRAARYRSRRAGKNLLSDYLAERATVNDEDACTEGMARLRKAYITERCAVM